MASDSRLINERFPRSSTYHPEWILAGVSGGGNSLWLTEWPAEAMQLGAGMRVLDLGCGRGASSIFLHREFGAGIGSAVTFWTYNSPTPCSMAGRSGSTGSERYARTNRTEIEAVEADRGHYLGYVRALGRCWADADPDEPIMSVLAEYARKPLLRS